MNVGDLVRTVCFGPNGEVGEVGIVIEPEEQWGHGRVWQVLFNKAGVSIKWQVAAQGLEVLNESR